jgi:hypothetical protein
VDEDGVLFSARRAWLAGQLHPIRSDRAPEEVVRRWFIRRLERAEQAVPYRGADAEVHDLSVVMEVMESLESSQVGDAREVFAAMVLQVVHKGEIVASGIKAHIFHGAGARGPALLRFSACRRRVSGQPSRGASGR